MAGLLESLRAVGQSDRVFVFACPEAGELDQATFDKTREALRALAVPRIVVARGTCTGYGFALALAADIRLATSQAELGFGSPGLTSAGGALHRLVELTGPHTAGRLALTGRTLSGDEARRLGLVAFAGSEDAVAAEAERLRSVLSGAAPLSLRAIRSLLPGARSQPIEAGLATELDRYMALHATEDRTEGLTAARERRAPRFHGR
jgi:enoyl-CoA hydratase/carnithine racemase